MSKRKAHSMHKRMHASLGAVLRTNYVAVVHLEPSKRQQLVHWKNGKRITYAPKIIDALCDYTHIWTIYFAGFCIPQVGDPYVKGVEIVLPCRYLIDNLDEAMREQAERHLDTCNPKHLVGSGWIAIPNDVSLDEEQAARIFEAAGAWNQKAVA